MPKTVARREGRYTAEASWDARDGRFHVALEFRVQDWKQDVRGPTMLAVKGLKTHTLSIGVHTSFGAEEDWGPGDIDFDDVQLSVTLALQGPHGEEVPTCLWVQAEGVSLGKGGWKSGPPEGPAPRHRCAGSVARCFTPTFRFLLEPVR